MHSGLNPTKTQVMWPGSSQQLAKLDITHVRVLSSCVAVQDTARDLGVVIDSQLSLSAHVTAVCWSGYYQLRQVRQAVRSLSEDASKTLAQAFVSCRLEYCNSLFFGISEEELMNRLLVSSERRCPSGDRYSTLRPYITDAPSATLATSAPAHPLQGGHVRPPRRCLAFRHRTWLTIAVLSPMLVIGGCVPQRAEHASWRRHTAPSATARSRLLDPDCGTVFHRTWKTLT